MSISFLKCNRCFWTGMAICFIMLPACSQNFSDAISPEKRNSAFVSMISVLDSTAKIHSGKQFFGKADPGLLIPLFQPFWNMPHGKDSVAQGELDLNQAKIDLLRKEYGVKLKAGYLENIDKGIFGPGDIYYHRRGKLEVEWNLLNNGFFENRREIKELELENDFYKREWAQTQIGAKYGRIYNQVIYYFNEARIRVIQEYLSLQNMLLQTSAELYHLNEVPWSDVLNEMGQKARLENKLKAYQTYNSQFAAHEIPDVDIFALPLVDVGLNKILIEKGGAPLFNEPSDSLDYNPLMDVNLSLFARYNIFDDAGVEPLPVESFSGREYFSVGVDLSVPLFFNSKSKQKILELERKQEREKRKNQSSVRIKEIYNHYYEYEFTLQQYIQFYAKYLKINDQLKEQTLLPENDPEYSPRKLAGLLGQKYQVIIALVDLKQELYLKLLKFGSYVPMPVSDFVEPITMPDYFENSTLAKLKAEHIYIWSADFGRRSNSELIALLDHFSIKTVHLSFLETQTEKAHEFVQQAHRNGMKVFLLVGNNQLIYEKSPEKLKSKFRQAQKMAMDGVHLDVEPQVFEDWNNRRTEYQSMYVAMLKSARILATENNLTLAISVPHYFEPILSEITNFSDAVFIMVYETNKIEQIKKRIEKEAMVLNCKLVVALRPPDFKSIDELREAMVNLELEPCQNFALHDLGALLKLAQDEK